MKDVPYDDDLFSALAQDLFHLVPPPETVTKGADFPAASPDNARPAYVDKLKDDANPHEFHQYAGGHPMA